MPLSGVTLALLLTLLLADDDGVGEWLLEEEECCLSWLEPDGVEVRSNSSCSSSSSLDSAGGEPMVAFFL
jgi:hypothetical protein